MCPGNRAKCSSIRILIYVKPEKPQTSPGEWEPKAAVISSALSLAEARAYRGGGGGGGRLKERKEPGARRAVPEPTGGPRTFWAWTPSVFPASTPGSCPSAEYSRGLASTLLTARAPLLASVAFARHSCPGLWGRPLTCAPSCVVSRDRVPYQRDSGASACRISPPSGETAPLLPQAPRHRDPGGPAANMASLRCPGVLPRALAAQVGVTSLPLFSTS